MGGYPLAARDDDDDPRGVGRQPADGRGPARVLRVPRGADGAVGRPGGDGVHRRPPDRRDARPQRPAAGALHRHRRRLHRDGLGGRRARHPRGEDRQEVAAAAGQDAAGRHRAGPHRRRRGAEAHARDARSPTASGSTRCADARSRTCPSPRRPTPSEVPLLDRQQAFGYTQEDLQDHPGADGRRPARRRSARWATTPRCRCSPTGRRSSTTTSSSCSRR